MMDKIKITLTWFVLTAIAVVLSFAVLQGAHTLADWLLQAALTP